MHPWNTFFAAEVNAAAALAGLVLVAVSINLKRILSSPPLPSRALEAFIILFVNLIVCSLGLAPQPIEYFAVEVIVTGILTWFVICKLHLDYRRAAQGHYLRQRLALAILSQIATVPYLLGGVALLEKSEVGGYLVAVSILGSLAIAFTNAWILLIEINR